MTKDRIEKKVTLRAPLERVWRAIADSQQFGAWFGVQFEGPFVAGQLVKGKLVPTRVDTAAAEQQRAFEGMACDVRVERVEPQRHLSFRWQPCVDVVDEGAPTTLVSFDLQPTDGGTLLTITETGFDQLPLEKRAQAFADNEGGWKMQSELIAKYLDGE